MDDDFIQDLIIASNYLDLKCLFRLSCAQIATIIRGLSISDYRRRFNIVNDFTPEEEAESFDEATITELAEVHEKNSRDQAKEKIAEITEASEKEEIPNEETKDEEEIKQE